jgi:hypothetical protein
MKTSFGYQLGIDKGAQLDWSRSSPQEIGALAGPIEGGNPIELHLLFVANYIGASRQNAASQKPGERETGRRKLGPTADRENARQSVFKRIARHGWMFGTLPGNPSEQPLDRAGLRIAWKYVYLIRAGDRLTRYVE